MRNLVIIGGSKGIGRAILQQQLEKNNCLNISRSQPEISHAHLTHHSVDVLTDSLPVIENIDALVYCPGSINLKPISSLRISDFQSDFEINVLSAVKCIQHFLPVLKNGNAPSILLFSTVAVAQGMPFHASIAAAKAGVEALTKSLAAELAPKIRVNCIAPSITNTDLAQRILRNERAVENSAQRHPLKRILNPVDIAHFADYLINPSGVGMTGQIIGIDGGMSSVRI